MDDGVWPIEFQNPEFYTRAGSIGQWGLAGWEDPMNPDVEFRRGDFYDLKDLDLHEMEDLVVIPGRAFVHDREAERILTSDGKERTVLRGPEMLTADAETSMGMVRDGVLLMELEGFTGLLALINRYGHSAP
jgi:NifB/MoaA-like Fe-S oxidoreductase